MLSERKPVPKVVSVVNPGNPSGTYIPEPLLKVSLSISSKNFHSSLLSTVSFESAYVHNMLLNLNKFIFYKQFFS